MPPAYTGLRARKMWSKNVVHLIQFVLRYTRNGDGWFPGGARGLQSRCEARRTSRVCSIRTRLRQLESNRPFGRFSFQIDEGATLYLIEKIEIFDESR